MRPLPRLLSPRRLLPPALSYPGLPRLLHSSPARLSPGDEEEKRGLEKAGPFVCSLRSRAVLRFRGPDVVKFLQGLVTNDVRPLGDDPARGGVGEGAAEAASWLPTPNMPLYHPPPLYAAVLTPQGRFLYDLFLYRPPSSRYKLDQTGLGPGEDGPDAGTPMLFADVDGTFLDELLDRFRKYRLRSNVEIENVTEELTCWQRFGGGLSATSAEEPEAAAVGWGGGVDCAGVSSAKGNIHGWCWFKDPRLDCLGFRGIFPNDTIPPLVESDKETDERYYLQWRIQKGVAEGSTEIPKGEAIPLEYNLAALNAISFNKGCYVGQELVARTHHRGVIRKRLLPFKFTDESGAEVEQMVASGSEIVDSMSGKKVGSVTTAVGSHGIGLLRLEEAFRSPSLAVKGQEDIKVKVSRPDWWPAEWTQEFEQQTAAA
ncbi:hypothetical protein Taro_028738 [Colocasia esculenta]|uniref:CAF17 C-terminal domain-containing protein n=1 Tax=Colocasia esculenta TaxID=4460 RepID=A0A843VP11_COLES|nr:hypothetical protein [Colocasia esculenta]